MRPTSCINCFHIFFCNIFLSLHFTYFILIYSISSILILSLLRSVDVLAHLGGEGLAPYYCLIEGGRKGWLLKEMIDLFYYAQILHQGENTTATRIVSEKVSTKQIPNLMRAVGYYPSNEEVTFLFFP